MQAKTALAARPDQGVCQVSYVDERRVWAVNAAMPSEEVVAGAAELFACLSGPTRLRILFALAKQPELCVCDLARIVGRSMSGTSHQLQTLRHLGLVAFRMEKKLAYYRLTSDLVRELVARVLLRPPGRKRKAA